jgi:hypothetical protein
MQAMIMQLGNQQLQHLIKSGGAGGGSNVNTVDCEPPEYDQRSQGPKTGFWE